MRYRPLLIAALACGLTTVGALADMVTVTHEEAGICFDVPETWQATADEDDPNLLIVTSPDEDIVLQCWVVEDKDLDEALEGIGEGLGEEFEDLELDEKVEEATVNDLDRAVLRGHATVEGNPVLLSVILIDADKPVIFLASGSPDAAEAHRELLDQISASIRVPE